MNKPKLVLVGGGGHCKACIDVIELEGKYEIAGILDVNERIGQKILGYDIIGNDDEIPNLINDGVHFLITVGHMGITSLRNHLFRLIDDNGGVFATIISPLAHVSKHAIIRRGTIVLHFAIISTCAKINENCIINNHALVEHDVIIGCDTHISTGAKINGNCCVGECCFIGSGTIINQGIELCSNVLVGSASLIRKDIVIEGKYVGNPLRKI